MKFDLKFKFYSIIFLWFNKKGLFTHFVIMKIKFHYFQKKFNRIVQKYVACLIHIQVYDTFWGRCIPKSSQKDISFYENACI